jgi:hypothetical protein
MESQSSIPESVREEFTDETMLPVIRAMAEPLIGEGLEVASAWMKSAMLNDQAREAIAGESHYFETQEETGRWID